MKTRGFTIVELVMVIGIIAVLITMVTTAASQSVRAARDSRASAMCEIIETGLATYYAQKGEWPGSVGSKIANGSLGTRSNELGADDQNDSDQYVLNGSEVRDMIKAMVDECKKGNPVIDLSGLYVSRNSGEIGQKSGGLDFISAIHGTKETARKMKTAEMYYGYQNSNGYFRRFNIIYSIPTDKMMVSKQSE
jgi:prepilin-type N-terminal cleavage/methylation domain-containing protein